jgi:hypothetical protein
VQSGIKPRRRNNVQSYAIGVPAENGHPAARLHRYAANRTNMVQSVKPLQIKGFSRPAKSRCCKKVPSGK